MKHIDRTAKWVVGGLAVAVALSGLGVVTAGTSSTASTYHALTPCRLADTRPGPDQIGPRATPLGAAEEVTVQVRGTNGECSIPAEADAVNINVIAVNPTNDSFLSIWPADAANPGTSSLNYLAGQPPTPNFITTALSSSGAITLFNQFGTVDVVVDVFGYYSDQDLDDRYYTKPQVDGALDDKADAADVYTKSQVYTKTEVDNLIPSTYISKSTLNCAGGCASGTYVAPIATCDGDDPVTGGSAAVVTPSGTSARASFPSGADGAAPAGWTTSNDTAVAVNGQLDVYAICADLE